MIICDGNGHVSPARKMKFEFDHTFGHPNTHSPDNLSILAIDVLSSKDLLSIGNTPALETSDVAS